MQAKGKPIGFLGGMDIPLIHRFENGFDRGMYAVPAYRKDGMILGQYIAGPHGVQRPHKWVQHLLQLLQPGPLSSSTQPAARVMPVQGAQEAKKLAIGVDSDQD